MNIAALQRPVVASDIAPERLAGNAQLTEDQKIAEASRQFEAILLRQVLESAQKTVIKSKFSDDSTSSSIYQDMITNQLADSISKSGALGLAKTFEHQLDRPHAAASMDGNDSTAAATPASSAEVAKARPKTRENNFFTGHGFSTGSAHHSPIQ